MAFLHERRLLAAQSRGGIVLVAGEAGIGKSRLIAEFRATLAQSRWRIGCGTCLEHAQRPYGPILDVLSEVDHNNIPLLPETTKREQLNAIVTRFEHTAAKTVLLGIVEDIHWADLATLELLTFLAPKIERLRILVVASFRPRDLAFGDPTYAGIAKLMRAARSGRIDLAPLDELSMRAFIDETAHEYALSTETRRAVARTSEGNPFFAEELLKSAIERLSNRSATRGGAGLLPSSLRATLLERWQLLSEEDRRIVAQAAVIGRVFDLPLLARTLHMETHECMSALARAREAQLVEELSPSLFSFRHALTRDAIYSQYLGAQVRPLHRTIALSLESEPAESGSLESLAYHWSAAEDDERAARYNELAGDAAGSVHAHDDAIAFYERALEASTIEVRSRGRIVEKIADRFAALGVVDRAHDSYGAAAAQFALAADDEGEARCRTRAAVTSYTLGRPEPTAPLEAMLERLDSNAYLARSRVHIGIAWLTASFSYPTVAARHLAQVDARALEVGELSLRYHNISAWNAMTVGDVGTFRREHAAWVDAAGNDPVAAANAHYNGAICYSSFGLHQEALAHIERALAIARRARNHYAENATQANAALCYLESGDLTRARAALAAIPRTIGSAITLAIAAATGTLAGLHLDDRDLIAKWFDDVGAAVIETMADNSCGAGFAEILMQRGRRAEAEAVLHRSIPVCERTRGIVSTLLAAAKYGAPQDVARARALLVSGADSGAELPERPAIALFDAYALRREGRFDEAVPYARAAADGFARLRFPLLEAAARESADDLDAALAIYERCGANGDVRRLRALEAPHGTTNTPEADGIADIALSKRELEIATLVARGRSNRDIGLNLAISHKTVEKHLGVIYQKLGFSTRAQLAAYIGPGEPKSALSS